MIAKSLEDITEADLKALIDNQVAESRTLDYKRQLPINSDEKKQKIEEKEQKIKFLTDVSSFANTVGGDILYGVAEEKGLPTEILGLQANDFDSEILRLEGILNTGLEPRLRSHFHIIECRENKKVLLLRIERSWVGPHRICFANYDKFYGRNDKGNYRLDLTELKTAFTQSDTLTERIRSFRTDRIIAISNGETPHPIDAGPKAILHCIPFGSFAGTIDCDVWKCINGTYSLPGSSIPRLTFEGILRTDSHDSRPAKFYAHLYRSGLIEIVHSALFLRNENEQKSSEDKLNTWYERSLFNNLDSCFKLFRNFGIDGQIAVLLSVTNVQGLQIHPPYSKAADTAPFARDIYLVPEAIADTNQEPKDILLPLFHRIWNACGYKISANFDSSGNWIQQG
jgi:hypothetical protein